MKWIQRLLFILPASLSLTTAYAQQASEVVEHDGIREEVRQQWSHVGLLRARDLSAFGLLRLDMDAKANTWTFEIQYVPWDCRTCA